MSLSETINHQDLKSSWFQPLDSITYSDCQATMAVFIQNPFHLVLVIDGKKQMRKPWAYPARDSQLCQGHLNMLAKAVYPTNYQEILDDL